MRSRKIGDSNLRQKTKVCQNLCDVSLFQGPPPGSENSRISYDIHAKLMFEFEAEDENVSKPLRLCMKVTCRILKGRVQKVETTELAKTFMQNSCFGSQNVEKPPCLSAKSLVARRDGNSN